MKHGVERHCSFITMTSLKFSKVQETISTDLTSRRLLASFVKHAFNCSLMFQLLHSSLLSIHLLNSIVFGKLCQHLHTRTTTTDKRIQTSLLLVKNHCISVLNISVAHTAFSGVTKLVKIRVC